MMGMVFPHTGRAGILPHDMATIEALIEQHKLCMGAEDQSNQQLAANAAIKAMVKDVAKKYDDVKSTLDKKSGDVLAYLSLAAEMSRCVTNTVKLTKEYSEFSEFAAAHVSNKPMIAWYTLELNQSITNMRDVIQQAYMWCDLLVGGYVHEDHIWEILNSSVLEDIGKTVINEWPG